MNSRSIPVWKDPFNAGFELFDPKEIVFNEGVTILTGCNGAGKSTLLRCIESNLVKDHIPCMKFNNFNSYNRTIERALFKGRYDVVSTAVISSEGENITIGLGDKVKRIHDFLENGEYDELPFGFLDEKKEEVKSKERWILLDAIDSGWSIDNIIVFKQLLEAIQEDAVQLGVTVYIIITANSYEMCIWHRCIDVYTGEYITFANYDAYKEYILMTAARKEQRNN